MPELSLTDFVDVVSRSGTPKATKIAEVKNRPPYNPATDFYKPLREGIIEVHKGNETKRHLDFMVSAVAAKKQGNYADLIKGYKKWWGNKSLSWFTPPRSKYTHNGVDIIINPELGLLINGQRHVIKMYLKSERMTKFRMDVVTQLLHSGLVNKVQAGDNLCLLDVRYSKLFQFSQPNAVTGALINAELAYIASIWPTL